MLEPSYTNHAIERMEERGISRCEVSAALYNGRHLRGKEGKKVAHRRLDNGCVLRVVYRGPKAKRIVETVYYKKYEAAF